MSSAARGGPIQGLLRKAWDAAGDLLLRKECVGIDKNGNKYYRYFEKYRGETTERREVRWNTVYVMYSPTDVPSEWRMWLKKLRKDPPTDDEMARSEAASQAYANKVAAVEERERLARLRMQSMGTHAQQASKQPDMSRFLQNMGSAPQEEDGGAPPSAAAGGSPSGQPAPRSSEPSGSGDGFTPGAWKPGQ